MEKPLTVLFNTYTVAFDCPGGGEVQLVKYEEQLKLAGVRVLRYDPWNPRPQFEAADLVHYFSVQWGSIQFCHYVAHRRKLPLVISTIAWMEPHKRTPPPEVGELLKLSSRNLPNSQAECDQLSGIYGIAPEKFTPIVNGVNEIFFEPAQAEVFREKFKLHAPFVLCMGNIEARKNQLKLIEALTGSGLHLVLAGQEREAEYAARCRRLADDTVHFTGALEHGSLLQRSAYAAAEALVLPSSMETPGLAALEAAAAGCRLALTREGCTKEYFGDYAVYLNPDDAASIRQAVEQTLARARRPELPEYIRGRYTWKRAAEQLLVAYKEVLRS